MARKIKFALEMADGAKVRGSLEELREHFDLESSVRHFLSGKLTEWLDDRYYEKEAEALEAIDKDAPDLNKRLCEALGVEYEAEEDLDVTALERLNEKKSVLRQRTDDEEIIKNADKTALTQEDLADLLDMGEDIIYLCGEEFTVPARVKNKKYIGILGTPKVAINAKSQEELESKGILFENVALPWGTENIKAEHSVEHDEVIETDNKKDNLNEMNTLFQNIFGNIDEWLFLTRGWSNHQARSNITDLDKKTCIKIVCKNKYSIEDIVHMCMDSKFTVGWALTYDSFCARDLSKNYIIKYKDIIRAKVGRGDNIIIETEKEKINLSGSVMDSNIMWYGRELANFLSKASLFTRLTD